MNKIFIIGVSGIFLLSGILSYAADTVPLDTLVKIAQENNPEILAAKKQWEASLARVPQAKSLDNPNIGLTFEKIHKGTLKLNETMPDDRIVTFSQFIPLFGKLSLKGKIALVESQMFAAEYKNKELEVVNLVKNAYYDLFMKYKEIELKKQILELLKGIAGTAEAKYAVSAMTQEEVYKIHSEIARLNNDLVNLEQEKS